MRYTGPTDAVKAIIRERDKGMCLRCREKPAESLHHRIGRGMGGSKRALVNGPASLVSLCGSGTTGCHGYLTEHPSEAFATGWSVRRNGPDLPSEVPLVDLQGRLFFLTEEGDIKYTTLGGLWPEHPETIERPW